MKTVHSHRINYLRQFHFLAWDFEFKVIRLEKCIFWECQVYVIFDLQTSDLESDRGRMTIKTLRRKWMTTWHAPSMPEALTDSGPSTARSSFFPSETKKLRWVLDKLCRIIAGRRITIYPRKFFCSLLLWIHIIHSLKVQTERCILGIKDVWRAPEWDKGYK